MFILISESCAGNWELFRGRRLFGLQLQTLVSRLVESISSYDSNVMLAAVVSLLLVILFVLLLHIYAKWFLAQARQRRRNSISVSQVLRPAHRFHHFHTFTFDTTTTTTTTATLYSSPSKGLEPSSIASIPLFVYTSNESKQGLECVICLSGFEDNDVGRSLPKCSHCFHVECIDMWLHSHSSCPICRAPVVGDKNAAISSTVNEVENDVSNNSMENVGGDLLEIVVEAESRLERLSNVSESNCEISDDQDVMRMNVEVTSPSTSSSSSSSLGCSLKRMLSRNRSECKVFPSSKDRVNELDA
ncbi:RING-H2 finger protein ATL63 isoform X2 [Pistacia vera]|uniref:RING-H2 finger protein ATL63 isoform X2 n=1 Tax=Pistacia vera TaxID=55513 RepID=UPI001262BF33|nr:RING-H2 finger protein ATL63 isoform X2 [Pistacia vera]